MGTRRRYESPKMYVENFVPNEYVAACYTLACEVGNGVYPPEGYQWDRAEYGSVSHSPTGETGTCADPLANRIITSENGVILSIDENNNQQGWISGGLDEWFDMNNNGVCDPGDVIYWHTYSGNHDRRWNHWGYATAEDPSHPNHS